MGRVARAYPDVPAVADAVRASGASLGSDLVILGATTGHMSPVRNGIDRTRPGAQVVVGVAGVVVRAVGRAVGVVLRVVGVLRGRGFVDVSPSSVGVCWVFSGGL